MKRFVMLVIAAGLLASCAKEKDVTPPAELVEFEPAVRVDRVWSASVKGDDVLRLGLQPAVAGERVYAAGHGGDVRAFELASGRELWRASTELELAGGPAVGEGLVVVGGAGGRVIALDAETGDERWRALTTGEVIASPAVDGGLVVIRTVDGKIRGFRAEDGREAWLYEQPMPRLTLRGNAPPVISGDTVYVGLDNGKVVALTLRTGELLWNTTVAPSQGRTEIERLVDIDSPVRVAGSDLFVVGYQGRVAMLARDSGQIWWGRELSSHRGLVADDDALYVTRADSTVMALRRRDGTPLWEQDDLLWRSLTAPILVGDALVVADFEGYVHWLDRADGRILARGKTGGGRITNAPVAAGELLVVQTDSGEIQAWRTGSRAG